MNTYRSSWRSHAYHQIGSLHPWHGPVARSCLASPLWKAIRSATINLRSHIGKMTWRSPSGWNLYTLTPVYRGGEESLHVWGSWAAVGWTAPLDMETPCSSSLPLTLSLGRPDLTSDATSPLFIAKEFMRLRWT